MYIGFRVAKSLKRTPYSTRSFDFKQLDMVQRYQFLCGIIIPRPIAVISTVDKQVSLYKKPHTQGINNISVVSFFAPVTSQPPTLTFSLTAKKDDTQKDTYHNIMDSGHFVISCLTENFFDQAYKASQEFPPDVDEFKATGLTPLPSVKVIAPRIKESPVSFECSLYKSLPIGDGKYGSSTLIVGEVLYVHIDEKYCDENGELNNTLNTVSRLGGLYFGTSGKGWEVENPLWSTKNW